MVVECQQHPDYQQAISALLDLAEQYGGHAGKVGKDGSGTLKSTRSGLAKAEDDLKARSLLSVPTAVGENLANTLV